MEKTHVSCDLCNLNSTAIVYLTEKYQVVKCKNCDLTYVNPQPSQRILDETYPESYYTAWFEQEKTRIPMWEERLSEITRISQTGRLLDVGCGIGTFLEIAQAHGWEIYGTEVSRYCVQYTNEKLGLNTVYGDITEIPLPEKYFDVVTLWHVLEHTSSPSKNLAIVNSLLKDNGFIVIEVPNVEYYVPYFFHALLRQKLHKQYLYGQEGDEIHHLYFFSQSTIKRLLEKTGFQVVKMVIGNVGYHEINRLRNIKFRVYDAIAKIIYVITRQNYGKAIKVCARKIAK